MRPPGWSDAGTEGRRTLPGMSSAAKVIDWNGHDVPEALRALPPGRYVFERVESAAEAGLTDEEQEGLRVGMAEIERGETVPWETIRDEHRSRVAARPTAR